MIWIYTAIFLALLFIHTLASYVDRIYSELGKFLSREFEDNMEVWEQQIEPTLGFSRERLALCAAVLAQLSLAAIVLVIGAILFGREGEVGPPMMLGVLQAALGIVLVVVIFSRLLPYAFFTRTHGAWVLKWRWLLRLCFFVVLPAELTLEFLLSIVSLAKPPQGEAKEDEGDAVDALRQDRARRDDTAPIGLCRCRRNDFGRVPHDAGGAALLSRTCLRGHARYRDRHRFLARSSADPRQRSVDTHRCQPAEVCSVCSGDQARE